MQVNRNLPSSFCSIYDIANLDDKLKNQGKSKLCWDFAINASAEIIVKDTYSEFVDKNINKNSGRSDLDFSEKKIAYYFGRPQNDSLNNYRLSEYLDEEIYKGVYEQNAGDAHVVIRSLAFGNGMVSERKDKSLESSFDEQGLYKNVEIPKWVEPDVVLKEAIIYNFTNYKLDDAIDKIKALIYDKKALVLSFMISSNEEGMLARKILYKRKKETIERKIATYYRNQNLDMSHAVAIIGWDDDFQKENFDKQKYPDGRIDYPEGNGAWIIKNSYDDECYYYLSYYHNISDKGGEKKYNFFYVVDPIYVPFYGLYNNNYNYGLNLKKYNTFNKFSLKNNKEKIGISFVIREKNEKISAVSFESECEGKINLEIYVDGVKTYKENYDINEGLNYLSVKSIEVSKNQIVKIVIENISEKELLFYLQEADIKYTASLKSMALYKCQSIKHDDEKQLFRLESFGEKFCTYIYNEKEETFSNYYNNGKQYVLVDIALLTLKVG